MLFLDLVEMKRHFVSFIFIFVDDEELITTEKWLLSQVSFPVKQKFDFERGFC